MSRAALLDKIKKCLALAAGASEHEAAAALGRARELMDLYGVDEAEVALLDVGERVADGGGSQRPPQWELILVTSIVRAIPTKVILGEDGWTFVGLTPAPEIAAYSWAVLHRQIKRARAGYIASALKRCSLKRKRARADVFCEGWATAVFSAVARLHPETPTDPLVRRYLDERFSKLVSVKGREAGLRGQIAADDRARGRAQGAEVSIHQGVGRQAAQLQIEGSR